MIVNAEFRLMSDRRDGLLLAMGQILMENDFIIRRKRLTPGVTPGGAMLFVSVSGPQSKLLVLEEAIATHPLIRGFEMEVREVVEGVLPSAVAAQNAGTTPSAVSELAVAPSPVADPSPQTGLAVPDASGIDRDLAEAILPKIAGAYPAILQPLTALEQALRPEHYEATMYHVGLRVGTWVYKRDFALGGRLELTDAVRRIALPALRQVMKVELAGDTLQVMDSPFCGTGQPGQCCHFVRGMLGGLLGMADGSEHLTVWETRCRNTGADACHFVPQS